MNWVFFRFVCFNTWDRPSLFIQDVGRRLTICFVSRSLIILNTHMSNIDFWSDDKLACTPFVNLFTNLIKAIHSDGECIVWIRYALRNHNSLVQLILHIHFLSILNGKHMLVRLLAKQQVSNNRLLGVWVCSCSSIVELWPTKCTFTIETVFASNINHSKLKSIFFSRCRLNYRVTV